MNCHWLSTFSRLALLASLGLVSATVSPTLAHAGIVPQVLNHQGRLLTSGGEPVSTQVTLTVRIYPTAQGGTPLWTESHEVLPKSGWYAIPLGSLAPFPADIWNGQVRYLAIQVNQEPEMQPRSSLGSVPYALVAQDAVGDLHPNSVTVGGTKVIDDSGNWVGPSSGLQGPAGEGVEVTNEAPGPNCTEGGVKLVASSGTYFVCDGASGTAGSGSNVIAKTLLPGSACPVGGVELIVNEVSHILCHGIAGTPGAPGAPGAKGDKGDAGPKGDPGTNITGASEPVGENCAYGGVKLSGSTGDHFVCNGKPGGDVVVTQEGPSAQCANGGIRVVGSAGDEAWSCHGKDGAPGTNGASVVMTAEPPGENCEAGGQKLTVGTQVGYVCNAPSSTPVPKVYMSDNEWIGWPFGLQDYGYLTIISRTGYLFRRTVWGTTPDVSIYFSDVNCTGQPMMDPIRFDHEMSGIGTGASTTPLPKQAAYSKYKTQWVAGLTYETTACAKSVDTDGLCNNLTTSSCGKRIKGELSTPEIVGLPATYPAFWSMSIKVN